MNSTEVQIVISEIHPRNMENVIDYWNTLIDAAVPVRLAAVNNQLPNNSYVCVMLCRILQMI
jgi:hypothetical protein